MQQLLIKPKQQVVPFTEAHVCLVEGDQGSGKSTYAVAKIKESYDKDCVRIYCEDVLHIKCQVKSYDRKSRVAKIRHEGKLKLLRIPSSYKLHTPMRVFSNIHLFGLKFSYAPSFDHIMSWLRKNLMVDGWLLVDESYLGMNARSCMSQLGRELEQQYFQFRKMRLNVLIVTPMARLIDWSLRTVPTEHVHCEYNPKNHKITVRIRKRGIKGEKVFDFDGSLYWCNFDTNERVTQ